MSNAHKKYQRTPFQRSGVDLACHIRDFMSPAGKTDTEIAAALQLSQPYVSKLRRIVGKVDPKLFEAWRRTQIPVREMYALASLSPTQQRREFARLAARAAPSRGVSRGKGMLLERLRRHAQDVGVALGKLASSGCVGVVKTDFERMAKTVVEIPPNATREQRRSIAAALQDGYEAGLKVDAAVAVK